MDRRAIPRFELADYRRPASALEEFSVDRVEDALFQNPGRTRPHWHSFFQVLLTEGPGTLMHDFVDHPLSGVNLVFLSPGEVHSIPGSPRLTGHFASFTQAFYDHDTPPPSRLLDYPFFFPDSAPAILPVRDTAVQAGFRALFAEMTRECRAGLPGAAVVLRALLQICFTRAFRLVPSGGPAGRGPRPAQLSRRFRLAVEERFRELHHPARYAALLGVTPNHLNDTLRDQTGQTAGEVIRQRKVLEAKRLLLHSEWSVSEIAYHLGFADPSYFSRFFTRFTHRSPGAFRREIREKYPHREG